MLRCLLGDDHPTEGQYRAEEEGGDWDRVTARSWQEEKDLENILDTCYVITTQIYRLICILVIMFCQTFM